MIYFANPSTATVREAIAAGRLGQMVTPDQGNRVVPGARWVMDNGCFSKRWTVDKWLGTLARHQATPGCLFAVVPDVVADHKATVSMWVRWDRAARRHGYRCAFVLQDGCDQFPAVAEAVFIGGTTEFKLGPVARRLVAIAKDRGKWVHMGRVNSLRRLQYAEAIGCDSADGTYLTFGPDVNLPTVLRWVRAVEDQMALDLESAA